MRSPSRGSVTLRSNDPYDHPAILFNYMSTEKDWDDFRTCIRLTREIFEQPSIKKFIKYEIQPVIVCKRMMNLMNLFRKM